MNANTKIHHSDLNLYGAGNGAYAVGQRITGDDRAAMLREYRATGSIRGAFLVDPNDYSDEEDVSAMGPSVDEIDWTGFA